MTAIAQAPRSDIFAWKKFQNNPLLSVEYDSYPRVPANPTSVPSTGCTNGILGISDLTLRAVPLDDDGGTITAEFQFWQSGGGTISRSVNATSGNPASTTLSRDSLVDGATYNWHVRTTATGDSSGWTPTCTFKVDKTTPVYDVDVTSTAYTRYSPNYIPSPTPAGTPGQFTLNAKGNKDVTGFWVGIDSPDQYVATDKPGGKATVWLTPTSASDHELVIRARDAAGNTTTAHSDYDFMALRRPGRQTNPGDYNGDGATDQFARTPDGRIAAYFGDGHGRYLIGGAGVQVDANRVGYGLFRAGDWDGDGLNDLMALTANGDLVYHRGNGAGGYLSGAISVYGDSGTGQTINLGAGAGILDIGDFDKDGARDLLIRSKPANNNISLWYLIRGDGYGNLLNDGAKTVFGGISMLSYGRFITAGDVDGDGANDLLAINTAGDMVMIRGNGKGDVRYLNWPLMDTTPVFGGWQQYWRVYSPGDWNGDGLNDVVGVRSNGVMDIYLRDKKNPKFYTLDPINGGSGWEKFNAIF